MDIAGDIMAAFAQVFIYLFGLIFAVIGLACIFTHYRNLKFGRKVPAQLIGVRESIKRDDDGNVSYIYYPVVEYVGLDGKTVQAECDSGSSSLSDKIPGGRIPIIVHDETPRRFSRPGRGLIYGGGVLMAIAFGIWAYAYMYFPVTVYTIMMIGACLIWLGWKLRGVIKPKDEWETKEGFQARREDALVTQREALPMLDKAAVIQKLKEREKIARMMTPVFFFIGISTLMGGYFFEDINGPDGETFTYILYGIGVLFLIAAMSRVRQMGITREWR